MIEQAITTINAAIKPLNYFEKQFELCEQVKNGDKIYPAQYCSEGQYDNINFDNSNGVSYWRKIGDVTITDAEGLIACKDVLQFTYPMRLIGAVKKEKQSKDDAYSEERAIQSIISVITGSNKTIKAATKAYRVDITPQAQSDDALTILQAEYSEVPDINYNYSYFKIDVDFIFIIREDCIIKECD